MIAHPIRLRLYEVLVTDGPATAARLAKYVPAAPGSLSYHLRQLAECGYIEEAPELRLDSRERWWRAVPGGVRWSAADFEGRPGAREAIASAQRVLTGRHLDRLRRWQTNGEQQWGEPWTSAAHSTDSVLHLTPDELQQLGTELDAVLDSWVQRSRAARASQEDNQPAEDEDGSAQVFVFLHAFPFTDDPTEAGTTT
nr:winged helix-turn-helix domain-containing protein [Streptomyces sp. NBC_01177]